MVVVSLPNGKTTTMTWEQYENINYSDLLADDVGDYCEDPFYHSVIRTTKRRIEDPLSIDDLDMELPDEY